MKNLEPYLKPTDVLDCDHPSIIDYAVSLTIGEADETIQPFPVAPITPLGPFPGMTESSPPPEFVVELSGHPVESGFGTTGFIVIGPTPNDGIKLANQARL